MKAGTHSALGERSHTSAHRAKQGCVGWGRYLYPRSVLRGSETLRGQGGERRTLPLWDLGREVLSKNTESLRDSDALMRVAVPRRRGPAGLRDLFCFCRNCDLYAMRTCARQGRYHYPRCAPRAAETPDGRLSSRLICRFLRLGSHHWFQRRKIQFYLGTAFQRRNG